MIDLTNVSEIKNVLSNKVIDKIEDTLGNVIYEAYKKLTGVPPLTITSKGQALKDYKIYGESKQVRLPSGYQEVEWISSTEVIDLGIKTNDNMQIETKFKRTKDYAQYVYSSDSGSNLTTNTTAYITSSGNWRFGNQTFVISTTINTLYESIQNKDGVWYNEEKVGSYTDVQEFTSTNNLSAFGKSSASPIQLYYLKIKDYGASTYNYIWIPCKRTSDNIYGLYDIVNNIFYTNSEATITAGNEIIPTPTPSTPIEIESVGEKTKNLFSGFVKGIALNSTNGSERSSANSSASDFIPVNFNENTYYYLSGLTNKLSSFICAYNSNKEFLGRTGAKAITTFRLKSNSFTKGTPQGTGDIVYLRITQYKISQSTGTINDIDELQVQLEIGNIFTNYEPYGYKIPITVSDGTNSNTTNIYLEEPLRRIGDYADYIDFENGKVVRNIVKYTFVGTENWNVSTDATSGKVRAYTTKLRNVVDGKKPVLCNIYTYQGLSIGYPDIDKFSLNANTAFLIGIDGTQFETSQDYEDWVASNNYDAYFVLLTPTEETITLPSIPTINGTTIISVDTEVQPSSMYIKYKGR